MYLTILGTDINITKLNEVLFTNFDRKQKVCPGDTKHNIKKMGKYIVQFVCSNSCLSNAIINI